MSISTNEYKTVCGRHYTGELDENGIANGRGTMIYSGGAKYIGEYKNDKRHGQGIQYFVNGSVYYRGEWRNGKRLHPPYPGLDKEVCCECEGCCVPDACREKDKRPNKCWVCIQCLFCIACALICEVICCEDDDQKKESSGKQARKQDRMWSEMGEKYYTGNLGIKFHT